MAENTPSWIDYLNLGLTTLVGALGVYVALNLGRSADRLGRNGLVVASATFLLDDSPQRRQAGVQIVTWLRENDVVLPQWEQDLVAQIASQATLTAPTRADEPPATTPFPTPENMTPDTVVVPPSAPAPPTASQKVADQLFRTIGGTVPRLFIQIADPEQRDGAEALRALVAQHRLGEQLVIVPGIEKVGSAPSVTELRFLKKADQEEAEQLALFVGSLLGQSIPVKDLSARYETEAKVKPRTYELWLPRGLAIKPKDMAP